MIFNIDTYNGPTTTMRIILSGYSSEVCVFTHLDYLDYTTNVWSAEVWYYSALSHIFNGAR